MASLWQWVPAMASVTISDTQMKTQGESPAHLFAWLCLGDSEPVPWGSQDLCRVLRATTIVDNSLAWSLDFGDTQPDRVRVPQKHQSTAGGAGSLMLQGTLPTAVTVTVEHMSPCRMDTIGTLSNGCSRTCVSPAVLLSEGTQLTEVRVTAHAEINRNETTCPAFTCAHLGSVQHTWRQKGGKSGMCSPQGQDSGDVRGEGGLALRKVGSCLLGCGQGSNI